MREKMRAEHNDADNEGAFKHAPGGITDIEFMVQYLVLAAASDHPRLLAYTDNQRLLDALREQGLLAGEDARVLSETYPQLRALAHRVALGEPPEAASVASLQRAQELVVDVWRRTLRP